MTKRRWLVVAAAICIVAAAAWALMPNPIEVDVARVARGPLEVTVVEDGITRVRERYEVAAPVTGRLLRVEVHAGDAVTSDTPLVRIEPSPLDSKQEAQLVARLHSAERAASEASALLRRATETARRARGEADRTRKLAADAIVSKDALDARLTAESVAMKEEDAARFRAEATAYDVEVARAALGEGAGVVVVRAPVSGVVLHVPNESERIVTAGTPLVSVGDPQSIEAVADFLSTDAVNIRPGAETRIERWGGEQPLRARVRIVEPAGFTKVSALGVEEQRVNVVCDVIDPPPQLGDQFRVDVRVLLWSGTATKLPATALFRNASRWSVFAVRGGRARLQPVTIAHMSDTEVEIAGGVEAGEPIVVHPSDQIHDGVRVTARR